MSTTGAGEACVAYCLDRGYHVTLLADHPGNYDRLVDTTRARIVQCDTNDHTALRRAVTEVDAVLPVNGVTTTQDLYVPQAALVASVLGLPGMSYEAAAGVRNKYRMRETLSRSCPHLNPPYRLALTEREAREAGKEWGYPVVAKPLNANDSWNVRRLDGEDELVDYVRAAASWAQDSTFPQLAAGILVEGFIDGPDRSVETVQYRGGDIQLLAVSGRELMGAEQGYFAEAGDLLPLRGPVADRLFQAVSRALGHLGVDCGVIHTECRISDDGTDLKILEVNPRLAGNMLGSRMIEIACGASAIQQVVETALGNVVPWRPTRDRGAGGYCVSVPRTGTFLGVENLAELAAEPGVVYAGLTASIGDFCHYPPRSNMDFVARVITVADTPERALALAKHVSGRARVTVREP
jgi:cysteine synthase A